MRKSKYSILIICEGEKTEPLFFNSIRDRIIDKRYDIGDVKITIRPEPEVEDEKEESSGEIEHRAYKGKIRTTKTPKVKITGAPPLKWIIEGQKELSEGVFNEVWAVFDKDQHPKCKEAFEEADKEIDGKKVQVAFSSICFEYYILLHFTKIYYLFNKSECRDRDPNGKDLRYDCGRNTHPKDCHGEKCINGFARMHGFWEESKGDTSMFGLVEDKLFKGFVYSQWLRHISDITEGERPIYERNPYITVDRLIKRLTGETNQWRYLSVDKPETVDNAFSIEVRPDKQIQIVSISTCSVLISENSFEIITDGVIKKMGKRILLQDQKPYHIDCSDWDCSEENLIVFTYNNNKVVFDFNYIITRISLQKVANQLVNLSAKELEVLQTEIKNSILSSNAN